MSALAYLNIGVFSEKSSNFDENSTFSKKKRCVTSKQDFKTRFVPSNMALSQKLWLAGNISKKCIESK